MSLTQRRRRRNAPPYTHDLARGRYGWHKLVISYLLAIAGLVTAVAALIGSLRSG